MASDGNEEHLARRAQQGDREAFLRLYDLFLPKVYNRVKSKVPPQYVEDVTQEVFIAVLRSLHRFEQRSKFSTWLYTIVNRQIADFYRQRSRYMDPESVSIDLMENSLSDPPESIEFGSERPLVQKALMTLPDHYQAVIFSRFADGLTFAEIAKQREQSLEAVKSLYRRAIQALKDEMGTV
jgi:RNA polymerase sigma-70 factor (ECF subfamily)